MELISRQLDKHLSYLAWSLWTELGVAGLKRRDQPVAIAPEELIILTALLAEFDPRLRDEALDWCSRYHRLISPIRLQILAEKYKSYIAKPFSLFTTSINSITEMRTKWIVLETPHLPQRKWKPSGKSVLRGFEAPTMIHFRLRALFGVSARADLLAFLLTDERSDFSSSDLTETGYSKRRIANILDEFTAAGILSRSKVRNYLRYSFIKREQFIYLMGGVPEKMVHWQRILAVLIPVRSCLQEVEKSAVGVRVIDMRNLLNGLSNSISLLHLTTPPFNDNPEIYWKNITEWIINFSYTILS